MSETPATKLIKVKCPQCGQPATFSPENPFRPFCSERCRILDLGAWADESYRIPAAPSSSSDSLSLDDEDWNDSEGSH